MGEVWVYAAGILVLVHFAMIAAVEFVGYVVLRRISLKVRAT
jgi:hypothetical protein